MAKREYRFSQLGQKGMTLIEVMVSTGLAGIVFMALMSLLYFSSKSTSEMDRNFQTIEGVTDAVQLFSAVLPSVTRIQGCNCQSNSNSRASCVWDSGSPWYDPIADGGASAAGATILSGEYEQYDGTVSGAGTSLSLLYKNNIPVSAGESCRSSTSTIPDSLMRGCKYGFSLVYKAPVRETGSTPSTAGQLVLNIGSGKTVQIGAATQDGNKGYGITQLACGFDKSSGGTAGAVYVLNMKVKARQFTNNSYTNAQVYESWSPTGYNYLKGKFREIQLKYTMRNLVNRGAYFWKPTSYNGCVENNVNNSSAINCCSGAWDGTKCIACIASGASASAATACCSGALNGGNCR